MGTENILGVTLNEDGGEVLDVLVIDRWLVTVIAQSIVSAMKILCLLKYLLTAKNHLQLTALPEALDLQSLVKGWKGGSRGKKSRHGVFS